MTNITLIRQLDILVYHYRLSFRLEYEVTVPETERKKIIMRAYHLF